MENLMEINVEFGREGRIRIETSQNRFRLNKVQRKGDICLYSSACLTYRQLLMLEKSSGITHRNTGNADSDGMRLYTFARTPKFNTVYDFAECIQEMIIAHNL